jgi:beta-lactamase class A
MTTTDGDLQRRLSDLASTVEAKVAYSIVPLDGGAAIGVNSAEVLPTASTFKLYVLAAIHAAAARRELSLDQRVEYAAGDYTRGSGVLKLMGPGLAPTLRDHARLMIAVSDNVSTNILLRALGGPAATDAAVHKLGLALPATSIRDYITFPTASSDAFSVSSADDFTTLLAAVHAGRCTGSAQADEEIYWTLRRQQHRSGIARDLPCSEYAEEFGFEEYDRCGTKSGSMPGLRADVGIVETRKRSWAMAVLVVGDPDFNTGDHHPFNQVIAAMSRAVFEAWGRG